MSNSVTVRVIKLEDHFSAVIGQVSGETLVKAAQAGGHVVEAYAKINVNSVFSSKSTGGAGLGGSIQVVMAKADSNSAEVDVGPTVIYGRIQELGGIIKPVHAKMLSWVNEAGERIFANLVHIPPRPYLRPALDEHMEEVTQAMGYQLKKGIESVT